jgi:acyl carrier protein
MTVEQTKDTVKSIILKEFLPEENPDNLTEALPLVSSGVLDSLAVLKLVTLLEENFAVQIEAHEISFDNLDTIISIANFVQSKLS